MKDISEIKIASYNVLFVPNITVLRWILDPKFRFEYQINKMLPNLGADIICLQEVRLEWL